MSKNRVDYSSSTLYTRNPQLLLETILRNKIYNTLYWKEKCFALTSETIIDSAIELKYIGGTYGANKHPTEFISLVLKMLQIQPGEDIIQEYLSDDYAEYKYLRALAAFYIRLTGRSCDVYKKLEHLYNDYSKLRVRVEDGSFKIVHMDEYVEDLLNKESVFEVTLPSLPKRRVLEASGELKPRVSILEADLEMNVESEDDYLKDVKLNEDQSEDDSDNSINDKINLKKQKLDNSYKDDVKDIDSQLKLLDPNSKEYWILMRKKIGINQ